MRRTVRSLLFINGWNPTTRRLRSYDSDNSTDGVLGGSVQYCSLYKNIGIGSDIQRAHAEINVEWLWTESGPEEANQETS